MLFSPELKCTLASTDQPDNGKTRGPRDEIHYPTSQNKAAQLRFPNCALALHGITPTTSTTFHPTFCLFLLENVALFKTQIPDCLCEGRQRQISSQDVVYKHRHRALWNIQGFASGLTSASRRFALTEVEPKQQSAQARVRTRGSILLPAPANKSRQTLAF